jgi:type IV pilus assembly protein PilW
MNLDNHSPLQTQTVTPKLSEGGFSLIEVMVALTIGLVILVAVVQIFVRSHATYQLDEGMSRVQEAGRFSMDYLTKDIRMAGYLGCLSTLTTTGGLHFGSGVTSGDFSPGGGIRGYRYTGTTGQNATDWTPALPVAIFPTPSDVQPGSDVIVVYHGSDIGAPITASLGTSTADIAISSSAEIASKIINNDILLISDCTTADIFQGATISTSPPTTTITHAALSKAYLTTGGTQLMKLVARVYYIGKNATTNEPSLFRKELVAGNWDNQELVGGVESMKILYGVDTPGTGTQYVDPATVAANWPQVVSVRLGIIVRTPANVDSAVDTKTYHLLGETANTSPDFFDPPNDKHRRRVFNDVIRVRNN